MIRFRAILSTLIALTTAVSCSAPQQRPPKQEIEEHVQAAVTGNEVNLLAFGDWGINNDNQRRVAETMKQYVRSSGLTFFGVLCAGDNMYVKLKGPDDPMWDQVFETMYDRQVLSFPFYVVAGNHDYQNGKVPIELAYAQLNPTSRWKYPSPYYRLEVPAAPAPTLVTVLMLDSNRDALGKDDAWRKETEWMREELAKPQAEGTWRIAVAHHPLFSNGEHGDNGVMQTSWGRLFKQYGLDMYVCGHDHDMQHLELQEWPMSFILVGGGGASTRPMFNDQRGPFSKSMQGFAHLQFTPERMTVKLIDRDGNVVHAFERNHAGQVHILQTSPSDVGKPRTPKTITRPDLATRPTSGPATEETSSSAR
jgi:3',5'-cyclic AMP phosphodiesterase CpdA